MKQAVKNLFRAGMFFTLLIVLLWTAGIILRPKNNTKAAGMTNVSANGILAEPDNSLDVLFLGDSETYNSFIPLNMWEDYGFTSYVCGTGGQPLYDSVNFAERTFKNQSPKLVILETNALFRPCSGTNGIKAEIKELFPALKFHDRWKTLTSADFTLKQEFTQQNYLKGCLFVTTSKAQKQKKDYMHDNRLVSDIVSVNKFYLSRLADVCRKNNAELILVSAPSYKNCSSERHDKIQEMADKYSLAFLDFNYLCDELGISWEKDTKDKGDHLNYFGAVKVTDYLGRWLHEEYELPDHRQDAAYADWNACLKKFKEKVKGKA